MIKKIISFFKDISISILLIIFVMLVFFYQAYDNSQVNKENKNSQHILLSQINEFINDKKPENGYIDDMYISKSDTIMTSYGPATAINIVKFSEDNPLYTKVRRQVSTLILEDGKLQGVWFDVRYIKHLLDLTTTGIVRQDVWVHIYDSDMDGVVCDSEEDKNLCWKKFNVVVGNWFVELEYPNGMIRDNWTKMNYIEVNKIFNEELTYWIKEFSQRKLK